MTAPVQLFEKQHRLFPKDVWGRYRRLKWVAMGVLLAIYYFTPWIRWDRGPNAPDQAVLIDMPGRRAWFFGIEIWPQEVYFLTGILILAAVGLFFVTSLLGRVWCGYACPQTVWTDLFIKVEHWIQGDRNTRMKLDAAPLGPEKILKIGATHLSWLLIGAATGGAWVFYFNDAPTLARDMLAGQLGWSVGGWILGLTLSTYIMAGWAREQVCAYMCPYARFQSAMFDRDTLIISYDAARGEPRGSHKQGESWDGRGHCVDCAQCVAVCPMGIDIRDGLQMTCIACGLCVDACNGVMKKLELPPGLIRYDTERNQEARTAARAEGRPFRDRLRILRPRSFWYAAIILAVGGLMLAALLTRSPLELHVLHGRNPLLVRLSDGGVRNSFTIRLLNKTHDTRRFALTVEGLPGALLQVQGPGAPDAASLPVGPDSVGSFEAFVTAPPEDAHPARRTLVFRAEDVESRTAKTVESMFLTREVP